jgi:hypothetical protein
VGGPMTITGTLRSSFLGKPSKVWRAGFSALEVAGAMAKGEGW